MSNISKPNRPLKPKPAAIIISSKKDENYINIIKNDLDDLFQYYFGVRNWIQYRNGLSILSKFAYYSLTTLSGLQTLGEEYTNIVMIKNNKLEVPSFKRRFLFVLLQSCGQIFFEKSLNKMMDLLDTPNINFWPSQLNNPQIKAKAYEIIPHLKIVSSYILRLNTALFFLGSPFFSFLNRILKINYTALKSWNGDSTSAWLYKFIGFTSLFQLCLTISLNYYTTLLNGLNCQNTQVNNFEFIEKISQNKNDNDLEDMNSKCSLCLYNRNQTTSTLCGHLFCWKCINEWLTIKNECPVCRQKVKKSRLIYLQNHE